MKKILLTAIIAMFGMSAFAEKPAAGTKGYLYNAATNMFIDSKAGLSATEGQEFEIGFKSADSGDPATDYPDRGFDGAFFVRLKVGSNYLTVQNQPVAISPSYSQLVVKETENGWLISHAYVLNDGNAPDWIKNNTDEYQGAYIQVVDGALTLAKDTENEGAYWEFVDQDKYDEIVAVNKKIAGPTYPIVLTGSEVPAENIEVKEGTAEAPYAAVFTPSAGLQHIIQFTNFDVSEFRGYGYKKIVVEYAALAKDDFHAYAYNINNDPQNPNWDLATGMDNAPEWLYVGENKYEVELIADKIEDFTVFSWWSNSSTPIEIKAVYFSKEELAAEPEPEPEPEPVVFPAAGAQGYLYNPASGLFMTGQAEVTLVAKADVTTADLYNVWYKSDSENDGKNIRFSTSASSPWTSLRYNEQKLVVGDDGYCKWKLAIAEDGTFTLYYPSNYSAYGPEGYLTVDPEGQTFTAVAEATEYSKWKFLTQDEFDNLTTRISSVSEAAPVKGIFNVAGQQMKNFQKGLNIVDGKKVYVK